ncbi:ABC transporter ATP-binding protein [Thermosipho ferrireducens]|uniref:ABC transporter ATP-binding protein n=1 Tax=Thermosipho ferrireducens TaxID=2571116 RepID=A0ABX7S786_9BACT|nr:ABC transporter ATP-binding protein [Thermosipho ferrireducens]QTA38069.1 ABC transporter ATP-binding protein [Thermosipho ferrireducens]
MKVIEVKKLTKYYGKNRGVENLSFSVEEGEIFGFIGPNGAGKSTTIRLLLNFLYPDSGKATIFGKDCFKDSSEIKKTIGYIPGEVNYYGNVRVKELLEYSMTFYKGSKLQFKKRMIELAERFSLNLEQKIDELSLGNKKKVAIIQSLIHKPKLLIYDEPTNGLDPLIQNIFFDLIKEENKDGVTVFFSSHILSEVQKLCFKVAVIRDGQIVSVENIDDLTTRQYKKVKLSGDVDITSLSGVSNIKRENNSVSFIYSGNINHLINFLSKKDVKDVSINDPSLEEIFMKYYTKGE